jgi:hypothetical protein
MTTDWNQPRLSQTWANRDAAIKGKDENNAKMDYTGDDNLPDGTIRWSSVNKRFEFWDGSDLEWKQLADLYQINVNQLSGLYASSFVERSNNASDFLDKNEVRLNLGLNNVENKALSSAGWDDLAISQTDVSQSDVGLPDTGTNGDGNKTISSNNPSGGSDGDVWYKI